MYIYFTREGVIDFMEHGREEVFPSEIYEPMDTGECCQVLRNVLHFMDVRPEYHYICLKERRFDTKGVYVEYMPQKGGLSIRLTYEMEPHERVEIVDPQIGAAFESFFLYLPGSGDAYSEEETRAWMEETLRRYEEDIS